ncbi:MAG: aspartyl/asparaginyl beta-hydroxylase domain-containing protein [Flavobacteriales bacterium]|nr:aspartyl/asparaginyl beta-hydroxylase domain-containing protein [Flavobacteriales bacterium]
MEKNDNKTSLVRALGKLDISALKEYIAILKDEDWDTPEDFEANYNKKPSAVLNATQHIILRFSDKQSEPFRYFNCSRWLNFAPCLLPLLNKSTLPYQYEKGVYTRVMLAKLPPKGFIAPHTDGNETGSIPHKIHVPIQTNEGAFFYVEGEKFSLKEGEAYEVNNSAKHAVANTGNTDRIHLIFEYLDYNIQSKTIQQQIDQQ